MAEQTPRRRRRFLSDETDAEDVVPSLAAPTQAASAPEPVPAAREEMRPEMREKSSVELAAERAAIILGNGDITDETDKFNDAKQYEPDGWTYEWKVRTVMGQENPQAMLALQNTGWSFVPASRHPELMPVGGQHQTIERDGLVLMERPAVITEMMRDRERRRATDQVRGKEQQLRATPPGTFERGTHPESQVKITKRYEKIVLPVEKTA